MCGKQNSDMNIRYILLLLFCLAVSDANAQIQVLALKQHTRDSVATYVKNYSDSLRVYKLKLDSLQRAGTYNEIEKTLDARYYRLFTPLTFYYNIAKKQFDLSSDTILDEPDKSLLTVYMQRPDLVLKSQKQLDQAGTIRTPINSAITPDADIIEKVSPTVVDSDLAPVDIIVKKPNFWKLSGKTELYIEYNHTTKNWIDGNDKSHSSVKGYVTLWANYDNKKGIKWNNTLELRMALRHVSEDTVHTFKTNEDKIRYTGNVGIQAIKNWYYAFQVTAETQMLRGFDANSNFVNTDFLSPLVVSPSLGMDYNFNWFKGKLTGSTHFGLLASQMRYCDRKNLSSRHGIEDGEHFKITYGSEITINFTLNIIDGISWRSRIRGYTSYEISMMEFENWFNFRINKYLSGQFYAYPHFDDSRAKDENHGYWRFKENLSFGFVYSF